MKIDILLFNAIATCVNLVLSKRRWITLNAVFCRIVQCRAQSKSYAATDGDDVAGHQKIVVVNGHRPLRPSFTGQLHDIISRSSELQLE